MQATVESVVLGEDYQPICYRATLHGPARLCADCGHPMTERQHRQPGTNRIRCGRCCPACKWQYRPRMEVAALQEKIDRNEQYGPLTFQEWVYLVQNIDSLYNDWNEVMERMEFLVGTLCRAHGLDWRELYCKFNLKKPYQLVVAEEYRAFENEEPPASK